jgi:hypothetical protein
MLCLQDRNTGFLELKVAHRLMHSLYYDLDPRNNKHLAESQATTGYGLGVLIGFAGETRGVWAFLFG